LPKITLYISWPRLLLSCHLSHPLHLNIYTQLYIHNYIYTIIHIYMCSMYIHVHPSPSFAGFHLFPASFAEIYIYIMYIHVHPSPSFAGFHLFPAFRNSISFLPSVIPYLSFLL
jgi:hypothetical protein